MSQPKLPAVALFTVVTQSPSGALRIRNRASPDELVVAVPDPFHPAPALVEVIEMLAPSTGVEPSEVIDTVMMRSRPFFPEREYTTPSPFTVPMPPT